jgi:hypothetical protein
MVFLFFYKKIIIYHKQETLLMNFIIGMRSVFLVTVAKPLIFFAILGLPAQSSREGYGFFHFLNKNSNSKNYGKKKP